LQQQSGFLNSGWSVVACSRNIANLQNLKSIHPDHLHTIQLDLTDNSSIQNAAINITNVASTIDVLIHNAGHLVNKPFVNIQPDELLSCYQVNVLGPFKLTQLLHSSLAKNAHVLAISSMGGFQGSVKFPGLSAYSSSKAAIASLIECWQEEFKGSQQSYNCLCIGAVQTEMLENAFPGYQAPLKPTQMAGFIYQFATAIWQSNEG
jgi:3-oxoacyl-[acyl-carrier protein] reductase